MSGELEIPRKESVGSSEEDYSEVPITPTKPISPMKIMTRQRNLSASQLKRTSSTKITSAPIMRSSRNSVIYTHGRPPWYDETGQIKEPFLIGICGGSASGKTTVAKNIIKMLNVPWVSLISMDSFYRVLGPEEKKEAAESNYNFDHPGAFDFDLMVKTIRRLKAGKRVNIPIYDFTTHSRLHETKTIYGANVVILEGILVFSSTELINMMDLKVFVDTDADERLSRRLRRDISERGREIIGVLDQYNRFVKPAYDQFIAPSMNYADIIVPRGGQNNVALNLIARHVTTQLELRGGKMRSRLAADCYKGQKFPETLHLVPETKQVRGLHTFIRSKDTSRDAFIFYSDRLMRLMCEHAISLLPYKNVEIDTPQGATYSGRRLAVEKLCGVSIMRAGETIEPALCAVVKDISIGKILIQTNPETDEPELHYRRLPKDIADCHVILMDCTVATGAAAIMAVRVLLEHDVLQENITLCSLLMAAQGVHSIAYVYPKVKLVTTAVDKELSKMYHILPGFGNFGDRYFGTDYAKEYVVFDNGDT